MVKLLWFSDLHFTSAGDQFGYDPRARLDVLIEHISKHHSDAALCVISGDMVDEPTRENYAELANRLAHLPMPYLPMTGNHDLRSEFSQALALPDSVQDGFLQYAVTLDGLRLICLDTLTENSDDGSFCETRRDWLADKLARDRKTPTVVFCHHPPLALGYPMLDPNCIDTGATLLNMLAAAPNVRQLLFGHVHRHMQGVTQGLPFASIRSVLYQAPPPMPAWDWDSFTPAHEPPEIGVLTYADDILRLQFEPFCTADHGFMPAL
ncbi:metallophosphoesterase [Planktotalea sp.]|uniref:metallophosphoesterase n=1 Tax=Planktotalea sp. TaxID=2029877 RepID=UPI003D6AAA71